MGEVLELPKRGKPNRSSRAPTKLTKRVVDALRPRPDGDVVVWDSQLPGFCVRVKPSGVRSYAVQYRTESGQSRRLTLGRHGVLTTEQARAEAQQKLAKAKRGGDPLAERKAVQAEARTARSVDQLCDRYLTDHAEVRKKASSVKEDRRLIDKRIRPSLGKKRVDAVTREDVITLHHRLKAKPYEANRTLALLSKMFNLAELWGLRRQDTNPCRHVERYEEKARDRFLRDDEITKLGKVLAKAESERTECEEAIRAIRLLALTGCRLGETMKLPWDDVDLDAGVFRLRDAKRGSRLVPLGSAAIELLRSTPRRGEFVVPHPDDGTRPFSWSTLEDVWSRIRKRAGLEDVRLHDLRHTIGSIAGQRGWNAFTIKAILGHKSLATTDRYVTHDITPMRRAMDDVSGRVSCALAGKKPLKKRARSAKQDFRRD